MHALRTCGLVLGSVAAGEEILVALGALGQPKTKLIQTIRQCSELGTSGSQARRWPSLL